LFVLLEETNEVLSDEEQFHNTMISNWYPGQWSLEVKKPRFNPLESFQRLQLLNTHLVASNFSKKLFFTVFAIYVVDRYIF